MDEPLNIKLNEFVIEIEGVKMSIAFLRDVMRKPPSLSLLNFKRVGDLLEVRRYDTAEAATKFFEEGT